MEVVPSHDGLDRVVEIVEPKVGRNAEKAPDGWSDVLESQAQIKRAHRTSLGRVGH
jgi:hypothetical protein